MQNAKYIYIWRHKYEKIAYVITVVTVSVLWCHVFLRRRMVPGEGFLAIGGATALKYVVKD
jgi:hypothetical protein